MTRDDEEWLSEPEYHPEWAKAENDHAYQTNPAFRDLIDRLRAKAKNLS